MLSNGMVVRSVAGHDKDRFYMVLRCENDAVWIADGKLRKLEKPKRKNTKHLKKTNITLDPDTVTTDKKLRLALKTLNGEPAAPIQQEGGTELV